MVTEIYVKTNLGKTITLDVSPNTTLADIKEKYRFKEPDAPKEQKWTWNKITYRHKPGGPNNIQDYINAGQDGVQFEIVNLTHDSWTVKQYGIRHDNTLFVHSTAEKNPSKRTSKKKSAASKSIKAKKPIKKKLTVKKAGTKRSKKKGSVKKPRKNTKT
jgi:hypothetical protein